MIYNEIIKVQSKAARPTFDDITPEVKRVIADSKIQNGTVLIYTPHTTCSVQIQEWSDGQTYYGVENIMQDLVNVLSKIIPTCTNEGQYLHPCLAHVQRAAANYGEEAFWSLNTDAHLRSVLLGRSVTVPIINGEIILGQFGLIWFGDWDQIRARERNVVIQVQGDN